MGEMERQRHADPKKQKILQNSVKRPVQPRIKAAIKAAGKTESDPPPSLPEGEVIAPHDILTSKLLSPYEVLQGLESAVLNNLNGVLLKPDYNEVEVVKTDGDEDGDGDGDGDQDGDGNEDEYGIGNEIGKEIGNGHVDGDEKADDGAQSTEWDGTYIDVVNLSLMFECALLDQKFQDKVFVHIGLYRLEAADCNLVKFTRLSGERKAFLKTIDILSKTAGVYLTGLTDDAWQRVNKQLDDKEDDERFQALYKKCFPAEADESAMPQVAAQ